MDGIWVFVTDGKYFAQKKIGEKQVYRNNISIPCNCASVELEVLDTCNFFKIIS